MSTAITGAITAIAAFFGIPPGPWVAGVWIGVKIAVVGVVFLTGMHIARKRRARAEAEAEVAVAAGVGGAAGEPALADDPAGAASEAAPVAPAPAPDPDPPIR